MRQCARSYVLFQTHGYEYTTTCKDVSHRLGYVVSLVGETSGPVCDTSTYLHHGSSLTTLNC
uniref:Uncharacterized protein n=1 Tax=Aegilops tauschii subsp. strangulata TaxID=200361 RepID=A0A453PYH9_AEGTS